MNAQFILKKFFTTKTLLSFGLAFFIFYLFLSRVDIQSVVKIMSDIDIKFIVFGLILYYAAILICSMRWKILLENIKVKGRLPSLTKIFFLGQFVNTLIPARMGDLYRAHLTKKKYGISRSATLGTIFIEKFFNFGTLLILLLINIIIIFENDAPQFVLNALITGLIAIVVILLSFIILKNFRKYIIRFTPKRIGEMIINFEESASASVNFKTTPIILILTIALWCIETLIFYAVLKSININLGFFSILFVILLENLLITVPLTPSGVGVVEAGIAGILILLGIEKNTAVSVALLNGIVTYWNPLGVGFLVHILSRKG